MNAILNDFGIYIIEEKLKRDHVIIIKFHVTNVFTMASQRCSNDRDLANSPNGNNNRGQLASQESAQSRLQLNFHTPPRGPRGRRKQFFSSVLTYFGSLNVSAISLSFIFF